jgi:hypothetical protein
MKSLSIKDKYLTAGEAGEEQVSSGGNWGLGCGSGWD